MAESLIKADGRLNVDLLQQLGARPKAWEQGEPLFWDDPHISAEMLKAHLDPNTDAASRKPETIDRIVEWLTRHLELGAGSRVLDIGCGPGLYCERFHDRGLQVTGMDYSHRSIDYARATAAATGRSIQYVFQNYLTLDYEGQFDLIVLIYGDFAVLPPADKDSLLRRVRRALKPGGWFAFDSFTPAHRAPADTASWAAKSSGFWRPDPYLLLQNTYYYPEEQAFVDQYVVIAQDFSSKTYRNWDQAHTPDMLRPVLEAQGFTEMEFWGDLAGAQYAPSSHTLGVICR